MSPTFSPSKRLQALPTYLFENIDRIKQNQINQGKSLISLGIGDPDLAPPDAVFQRMAEALRNPLNHRYPSYQGMASLRESIARWYQKRFDVSLDPETEILVLIGSKEGIAHLPLALINPQETVLVPDPAYPVYQAATILAGGIPVPFALQAKHGFLPDFAELQMLAKKYAPKLLFLNYPNNPTSACATLCFFEESVRFAEKHNLFICHDNAYSEIYYDGKKQPSFLQASRAKQVGCEFHSLSKTFNMAGWRVGFVVGNASLIRALGQLKTHMDSGIFNVCQEAAIAALENYEDFSEKLRRTYQARRDVFLPALASLNLKSAPLDATFYAWAHLPEGTSSEEFVMHLIENQGIVATPGSGFGMHGEGYVRFALCADLPLLTQAVTRLKRATLQ